MLIDTKSDFIDTQNIWCAEYSVEQNAFHIETLAECIKHSHNIISSGNVVDYNIIGVFPTELEANKYIDIFIQLYSPFLFKLQQRELYEL